MLTPGPLPVGHGKTIHHCRCHPDHPGHAVPSLAARCEARSAAAARRALADVMCDRAHPTGDDLELRA